MVEHERIYAALRLFDEGRWGEAASVVAQQLREAQESGDEASVAAVLEVVDLMRQQVPHGQLDEFNGLLRRETPLTPSEPSAAGTASEDAAATPSRVPALPGGAEGPGVPTGAACRNKSHAQALAGVQPRRLQSPVSQRDHCARWAYRSHRRGLRPDGRERARAWEEQRAAARRARPSQRAPGRASRTTSGVGKRIEILRFLHENAISAARTMAEAVRVSRVRVCQVIQELEASGYVQRTEQNPRSSKQRYLLTARGTEALTDEQKLRADLRREVVN